MSQVELRSMWKIYPRGNVVGVKDLSFTVRNQEFLAILGPSGGGKSSTLRMLAGLEDITQGELAFDGLVVNHLGPAERNVAHRIIEDLGFDVDYGAVVAQFQTIFLGPSGDGLMLREAWTARPGLLERLSGRYDLAVFTGRPRQEARTTLERFARVGETYGVQTVYQVHSGPVLGSNCAGLMHLLRGLDPRWVGAYPDLGHMVLDGEDYPMGLTMVREYLSMVAVKDAYHAPQPAESEPPFVPRFVKLGSGAVNWRRALGALKALGFDGAFSVHTEYEFEESIIRQVGYADATPPNLEEWARADAAYLRRMWMEA